MWAQQPHKHELHKFRINKTYVMTYRVYQKNGNPTLACHCNKNCRSKSHIFIVGNWAKLIENLVPLGLEHDEHHFNKRPENA